MDDYAIHYEGTADANEACAELSEAQLQAAFLAARRFGKILDDDVLRAIVRAARDA
jgi:hypothetical protein